MKDKLMKNKNMKTALLCGVMVIIGVLIGMLINERKVPAIKNGDEVVASIDGKKFTANDLYTELKVQGGQNVLTSIIDEYITKKEVDDDDKKEAEEYADSYLENLKAQYESYGQDFKTALAGAGYDNEEAFKKIVIKDQLKNIVAENYIKKNNFSKSDIKNYYNEKVEGSMVARYILIQPKTKDGMSDEEVKKAEEEALKKANTVIKKLKKDEDFAELAKKYSDDSSTASEGGLFNGFTKDEVVSEFWDAVVALEDGKYTTEPVESSYGYFVILRVKQNKKPSLKDAQDDIVDSLYEEATKNDANIVSKAWAEIRKNYNLKINDKKIKEAYDTVVKSYNETQKTEEQQG